MAGAMALSTLAARVEAELRQREMPASLHEADEMLLLFSAYRAALSERGLSAAA